MNNFLKFICILLSVLTVLSFTACNTDDNGSGTTPEETNPAEIPEDTDPIVITYEDREYNVVEYLDSIKVTGRSLVCDEGLAIDWSASGIEFNAECRGTVKLTLTSTEPCKFLVYVDGVATTLEVAQGTANYTIASELAEGSHSFRIVKKSDNAVENTPDILTSVSKIAMCGLLGEKPADKKLLIEFIGDSITCGLGTVAAGSLETDATVTYAYKAAELLGADYSFVSISGIGVAKSTDQNAGLVMSDIYSYSNYYRDQTAKYEPTRQADIVVIALNTNDNGRNPSFADYKAKFESLIEQVKAIHGEDVIIVWVSTLMYGSGSCDIYTQQLFSFYGGEESGFYHLYATPNSAGAFTHPSVEGHAVNAQILADYINTTVLKNGD